jgi:hypothetical protein
MFTKYIFFPDRSRTQTTEFVCLFCKIPGTGASESNRHAILLFTETCDTANDCSPYGVCTFSDAVRHHICVCLPGYAGDGYNCNETSPYNETGDGNSPTPVCLFGVCWCPSGHELQNNSCVGKEEQTTQGSTDGDTQRNYDA